MANESIDRRLELRDLNVRAASGESLFPVSAKTDSSLKKNTGFVKKIRTINPDNVSQVLADVRNLSLEKYLSEITVSLSESLVNSARNDDALPYLEVVCALFQRFGSDFVRPLNSDLFNFLLARNISESLPRHKFVLKFVFNMHLVGLWNTLNDCSPEDLSDSALKMIKSHGQSVVIIPLLKSIMSFEPKLGHSLGVVVSFVKAFKDVLSDAYSSILPKESYSLLLQLFTLYANEIVKLLVQFRKDTLVKKERLRKASIRTGKLLEDLQEDVDAAIDLQSTFESGAQVLCELTRVDLPAFEEPQEDHLIVDSLDPVEKPGPWDDSSDCDFHTVIPSELEIEDAISPVTIKSLALDNLSEGECVVKFLALLENSSCESDILTCTVILRKFVSYNKATRHKLLKFLTFESKKADNVNLYARFLKINEEQLSDLITDLNSVLDQGFRSQIHHGRINFRTISFFVELVKFKLIPKHVVFHKIRRLTLELAGTNNALILLIFYQDCGKFLLYEPEYLATTKDMLELLQERSKSAALSMDEKHVIRNMFTIINSYVNPKPQEPIKEPLSTPIEDYVSQLIKVLVNPRDFSTARRLFQEIDFFNDPEAQNALYAVFNKPEELNSDNYILIARLLCDGGKKRRFLTAHILNGLVECVYRGLESNDYRNNVARTSQVKLIASFFNEKALSFPSIVDLLFRIICFGHPGNFPTPASICDIDKPSDYFRLFLCCTMLKDINFTVVKKTSYFAGSVKSLEGFLMFLQYYSFCKKKPFPTDIVLALRDVFTKFRLENGSSIDTANNYSDAATLLQSYTLQCTNSIEQLQSQSVVQTSNLTSRENSEDDQSSDSDYISSEESDSEDDVSDDESVDDESIINIESDEELEDSSDSDSESYNFDEDEEDEEQKRIQQRMEAIRLAQEKKLLSAMDKSIQELRQDASLASVSTRLLRMPAPSVLASKVGGISTHNPGKKLNFLSKSNTLREMNIPTSKLLDERIIKEQEEKKANQQKILSLVNQMD